MLPVQEGTQQLAAFPITTRCSLSNLPQDVIHYILLQLGAESARDCSLACKHLYVIIQDQDNGIWQKLYFRDFACYRKQDNDSFRQAYQKLCQPYEFNLRKGRFICDTVEDLAWGQGGTNGFSMSDGRLCIAQVNGVIVVKDLATDERFSLSNNKSYPKDMVVYKNQFFLLKCDGTVDIYNLREKEYLGTLQELSLDRPSPSKIDAFTLCGDKLILKGTVQEIWIGNIDAQTFSGPIELPADSSISCMAASEQKLFLGTKEGEILIFDIETRSHLNTLGINNRTITCLAVSENEFIASTDNGVVNIWDIDKENRLHSLANEKACKINSLAVAKGKLFVANGELSSDSSNCTIKIWDISTGECLTTLKTHPSNLLCIVDKKIFSGSRFYKQIKVYHFSGNHSAILTNIAGSLREDYPDMYTVMAQFDALPVDVKNAIYDEMYQLLKPFNNDCFGCGRDAFHNEHDERRLYSTKPQKAQAIENYLKREQGS
jgi:WD40 repeated domain